MWKDRGDSSKPVTFPQNTSDIRMIRKITEAKGHLGIRFGSRNGVVFVSTNLEYSKWSQHREGKVLDATIQRANVFFGGMFCLFVKLFY
jgi:hypothetical protein